MLNTTDILNKLNAPHSGKRKKNAQPPVGLADIMACSLPEVGALAGDRLTQEERRFLYQQAQCELKENRMAESRILSRANPQLAQAVKLGITQSALRRGYDKMFGGRADKFARPGSVASMFSPAGYLTELYREARKIHSETSPYHLNSRRPDLQSLTLTQGNMDNEISTLALSNEILVTKVGGKADGTYADNLALALKTLATDTKTGETPFDLHYETASQALALHDNDFSAFRDNPAVTRLMDTPSLLLLEASISPSLKKILVEAIPSDEGDQKKILEQYFSEHDITQFQDELKAGKTAWLSRYFGLTHDEVVSILIILPDEYKKHDDNKTSQTLLRLNKFIRLCKATVLSPADVRTITEGPSDGNRAPDITDGTVVMLEWVHCYMKRYGISAPDALVLAGALIGQVSHPDRPDMFTRLFNSPRMGEGEFKADGTTIKLNPEKMNDTFRSGVLKRAFQVNDAELFTLWCLSEGRYNGENDGDFACDIAHLSGLYQIKLLADVHGLSVTELAMLLNVSGQVRGAIRGLSVEQFRALTDELDRLTQWLKVQGWRAADLYLMTTDKYSKVLSPDIRELLVTLRDGLGKNTSSQAELQGRINAAAPFIAAACQLDSAGTAEVLLRWLEQLKPAEMTTAEFLTEVTSFDDDGGKVDFGEDNTKLVSYCQVLGQLSLIVRWLKLTTAGLAFAVMHPDKFITKGKCADGSDSISTLPHSADTVCALARFHDWLQKCGPAATEVLSALESNTLVPTQMAQAMGLDTQVVTQAFAHSQNRDFLSETDSFCSWPEVDTMLQWVNVAACLGITPADVARLIALKYTGAPAGKTMRRKTGGDPAAFDWQDAARLLQAGLNKQQSARLQAVLDEKLSTALSAYAAGHFSELWKGSDTPVNDRDELYGWLLLDNRGSAQVKTTRLAEAIASIQLYLNRALNGLEPGVENAARASNFFKDWDRYNKRYSTWAGISQLVYYPENYIDPTMRTGKTSMMDEMLQSLGQSQLTSDTVEAAFKTYMTRFEEIADINVLNGYHDSLNDKKGMTWLVGLSGNGYYYWRSVNISSLAETGQISANAWSQWTKITAPVNPVNNLIRPVIFQHRLYIVWLESQVTGAEKAKKGDGPETEEQGDEPELKEKVRYVLKHSHIEHDGTWSMPESVITTGMNKITSEKSTESNNISIDINNASMHCVCGLFENEERLCLSIYEKKKRVSDGAVSDKQNCVILYISTSGKSKEWEVGVPDVFFSHWDTPEQNYINTPFSVELNIEKKSNAETVNGDIINLSHGQFKVSMSMDPGKTIARLSFSKIFILAELNKSKPEGEAISKLNGMGEVFYWSGSHKGHPPSLIGEVNCIIKKDTSNNIGEVYFLGSQVYMVWRMQQNLGFFVNEKSEKFALDFLPGVKGFKGIFPLEEGSGVSSIYAGVYTSPVEKAGVFHFVFRDFKEINTRLENDSVTLAYSVNEKSPNEKEVSTSVISLTDGFRFGFDDFDISVPVSDISNSGAIIRFAFSGSREGQYLGSEVLTCILRSETATPPSITLNKDSDSGVQYLRYNAHTVRVNTLFARELTARAVSGIDTVLSMKTQQLLEPPVPGFYATITLPAYKKEAHGDTKAYSVWMWGHQNMYDIVCSGLLQDEEVTITRFIPYISGYYYTSDVTLSVGEEAVALYLKTQHKTFNDSGCYIEVAYNCKTQAARLITSEITPDVNGFSKVAVDFDDAKATLMDFSGCNGLYFWEMFYYIPMMVFRRLLQESRFTEATQWIKYIWSPEGYFDKNGNPEPYQWNVRPLEEETSWHADPLDSPDPDAVAQADPMHYKVATYMGYLDLLIARGDAAFRQLERDAFNEAKMWYVQALSLLGEEPSGQEGEWDNALTLDKAADKTTQKAAQQALLMLRGEAPGDAVVGTANSLTNLFLPQQNEKLAGYWRTLRQRLFNLRHNLSIDGQPLSLSIYASPASPEALMSAAVNDSQGGSEYPKDIVMPPYRFPVMLESARGLVGQLIQFGCTLLNLTERQDAETLSLLLQTQGAELVRQSITLQDKTVAETDKELEALEASLFAARGRLDSYTRLYEENISTRELQAMDLNLSASVLSTTATTSYTVAAGLDVIPNIYGMAVGGAHYGAIPRAIGTSIEVYAMASRAAADRLSQSEMYRRRRQEWEIQRDSTEFEVKQMEAQLKALSIRRDASLLQKAYIESQRDQTQVQLTFLKNKFTGEALYSWLRGKLSAIYYQFFDLTVSRCLMAQKAYEWSSGEGNANFIRPGAWRGNYAGLMAGEALLLNLTQMEQAYLQKDEREKEVTRTVNLTRVYGKDKKEYSLSARVAELLNKTSDRTDGDENTDGLKLNDTVLEASLTLSALNIRNDYPYTLGNKRRIKNISVTLPALVGPYQDVRAVLSYDGGVALPGGCRAMAVSHGMNDSGLFQLDFNDARWLPFEGIPVDDKGTLTLTFPDAQTSQKDILLSLSDIILHIRYTISA